MMASSGATRVTLPLEPLPISPSSLSGRRQLPRLHLPCTAPAVQPKAERAITVATPASFEEEAHLKSMGHFQDAFKLGSSFHRSSRDHETTPVGTCEFLGSGSMSVVRRCVRRCDGQIFAVKCVTAVDEEVRQFTRDEYELVRALRHPAIITFRAWFEGPVSAWIVMDLCSGGSLESFVRREGAMREWQVQDLGFQLIRGVDYLHHKRVVHRDLKPANLLLHRPVASAAPSPAHGFECRGFPGERSPGESLPWLLKITDFNSAKRVGASGNGLLLTDRGTQLFNAPELRFGRLWNERIDIWASGLCLYFMLAKHVPFNIGDPKVAESLLAGKLPAVDWSIMSPLAGNLIRQCLFVDPCDRPTAMELRLHPFFGSKHRSDSRGSTLEAVDAKYFEGVLDRKDSKGLADRRESKDSSTSSFTASRRISLEIPSFEPSVLVQSCGLIFGAAQGGHLAGREARWNRGSVWLEVEGQLQRAGARSGSKVGRASPLFLGGRSFPSLQLPLQPPRRNNGSSARMRSHSMYLSTPKACDAIPRSPQQSASHSELKEPRSFDVLLRMASDKFRQMNALLHEEVHPPELPAVPSATEESLWWMSCPPTTWVIRTRTWILRKMRLRKTPRRQCRRLPYDEAVLQVLVAAVQSALEARLRPMRFPEGRAAAANL
ncbi:unnamed protein product [Effrenium voratum]|uniref:Protein kinase domain-containing protein n=1 Tax=Effrenium voratum TaxID=2562239 RepID=A0AA36IT08_9DINO|nr:unnamed protein product [Effrenium voratum]